MPRPDPDSLLEMISKDQSLSARGRLKVFFGASAGVGKTFAMLQEAKRRLQEGVDVVAGVVETHGRHETLALLENIPVLPLKEAKQRDISVKEFDLEAALVRNPSLILMDELAHTNATGSLHPKRWQDVDALLGRGIDVFTTLNVQHLESVNDMVAKLTGVQVRETVPDHIFDIADDIALIDIPSDELLKRLHDGKVYIAEGASKRAAENFFKKTNLVALRELALRRTAERVDAQMDMLTAAQGQKEAQTGVKLLVCVGHDALSTSVVRHARRMAVRAKAVWYAVYVETGRHDRLTDKAKLVVDRNLRLAERIGARIMRISGNNAADEILNYARNNGVTHIVLGHQQRKYRFTSSLYRKLVEQGGGFEITTVTEESGNEPAYISFWKQQLSYISSYAKSVIILLLCTLLGLPLRGLTDANNITMVYLTGIVWIAARYGTAPSFFASLVSIAAFNFFFTEPVYTFSFIDPDYYYTFAVMLIASITVGSLASQLAVQAGHARQRSQETQLLYALTRELATARQLNSMAEIAIRHLQDAFNADIALCIQQENGSLQIIPEHSPARLLKEESVMRWVLENKVMAGHSTDTMPSARGIYFPLLVEKSNQGVLGILPKQEGQEFSLPQISQMETFASLIASALQRVQATDSAENAKVESEREKLRSTLLSLVSHDLRTPLTSIKGAASSALMLKEAIPEQVRELLGSIHSQADRLAKLVSNLLDITSLTSGTVKPNFQPYYIEEVIGAALSRVDHFKGTRIINNALAENVPLIAMDGLLIEQLLVNLLENAFRFTREDGTILVQTTKEVGMLRITMWDDGIGLTAGEEDKIFEKYHTSSAKKDGHAGLGLAICKTIAELHGGSIRARNNAAGGAEFSFTLPMVG